MNGWDDVVAAALDLPGAELGTTYNKPAVKVRGRMIAATTAPDDASFVLAVTAEEKEVLLDTDPATFWQTPHYDGWPVVLVRYATPAHDRIALLLTRAWWDRLTPARRRAHGDRP